MRTALAISALLASSTPALERLEPSQGCYFGFTLTSGRSVPDLSSTLGFTPAVFLEFFNFSSDSNDFERIRAFYTQVAAVQGIATITLEPWAGLDNITSVDCDRIAQLCKEAESHGIAGIFIRFAHEMNGHWYPWGQRPTQFKTKFRLLAETIHAQTSRTAMIWAPNDGTGYPFGKLIPSSGSPDFNLLDTNHDGQVTNSDDPFEPYYPGNDVVDWAGMTIYHWGTDLPTGGSLAKSLTDFYSRYSRKPIALTETAAFYNTQVIGADELQIKRDWWTQVLAAPAQFPMLKCINWFNELKPEPIAQNNLIDWRITENPQIRSAFINDFRGAGFGTTFLTANETMRMAPNYIIGKQLPDILPATGNISVSLEVKAESACDLVIDLLDDNFQWQGGTRVAVSSSAATIATSFRLAQPLTDATGYRWSIFLTPRGADWTSALAWYHGPNPSNDPDNDGATNQEESIAGTSPRNAIDVLKLNIAREPSQTVIRWNSRLGRTYQLLATEDLKNWSPIGATILGTGAPLAISQPANQNSRQMFYRLDVQLP